MKIFFFLSFFSLINHHHAVGYTVVSIDAVVLIAAATIIAIRGQKTLDWHLSKVIVSGMYNYNFEGIN